MTSTPWRLWVTDGAGNRLAGVHRSYSKAELVERYNAPGGWTVTVPTESEASAALYLTGSRLELERDGQVVTSGPTDSRRRKMSDGLSTFAGVDDTALMFDRLAHPEPATPAPPFSTDAYDVRTGIASTILREYADHNAGPSALGERRVSGLSFGVDPFLGPTITGRARWQNLGELLAELAEGAGLRFRVASLEFLIDQTSTSTVVLSTSRGNVLDYETEESSDGPNAFYLAGNDEGTARLFAYREVSSDVAAWRRREEFLDRRSVDNAPELEQEADEAAAELSTTAAAEVEALDVPGAEWGIDYRLGDVVTVELDGLEFAQRVRSVTVELGPDGETVKPVIGSELPPSAPRLFRSLAELRSRVSNLETR